MFVCARTLDEVIAHAVHSLALGGSRPMNATNSGYPVFAATVRLAAETMTGTAVVPTAEASIVVRPGEDLRPAVCSH